MKILIVEDAEDKRLNVIKVLNDLVSDAQITEAQSFSSGLHQVVQGRKSYELILLDMSMPNFDPDSGEIGGAAPENFAGKELLSQMKLRKIHIPTIVITQLDSFGEGNERLSLNELAEDLKRRFAPFFKGVIYYNQAQEDWKRKLAIHLKTNK